MAGPKLNKFQQSVLNNRLKLIVAEPAIDKYVEKQMKILYARWEKDLLSLIGTKNQLTRTQVAEAERKLKALRGKFNKITKSQLSQIQQTIGVTAKATHASEVYKHLQMIDGHLKNFDTRIGVSLTGVNKKAIDAALRQVMPPGTVKTVFGNIAPAVAKQFRKDVAQAIADGWTVDQLAKKWQTMNGAIGVAKHQTQSVARTMVMQASSNAQLVAYTSQANLVKGVQWEATFDSRTCPVCAGRHGHQYAKNEAPSQPAHFNCRCTWLPVFLDEKLNNKLDSQTAYKAPDNKTLVFQQQTREFDQWLKRQPKKTHKDFFGSRLKMKAWQEGKIDLESMVSPHGRWISDSALLKVVDPAWAQAAVSDINKVTQTVAPKLVSIPKGQLSAPIFQQPVAPVVPTPSNPVPISLPSSTAQSSLGTLPTKTDPTPIPTPPPAPKPIPRPPKAPTVAQIAETVPDPDAILDSSKMKKIGEQKGSNPGGLYEDSTGQKWYLKKPKSASQADNEVITAKLYEAFGVEVPELRRAIVDGAEGVASKWKTDLVQDAAAFTKGVPPAGTHSAFAIDAYLANWDVIGLSYDNIALNASGKAFRLDTGGGLLFRAQGAPKGSLFKNTVDELDTLRNPSINPQAASVFKDVADEDIIAGIKKILSVPESQVDDIIAQFGKNLSQAERHELRSKLSLRREDLKIKLDALESKKVGPDPIKKIASVALDEDNFNKAFDDFVEATSVTSKPSPVTAATSGTKITKADLEDLIINPSKPVSVIKIEPEIPAIPKAIPKTKVPDPTPLGMPKGVAKQQAKYGYDLNSTGSKGHKQLVAKAEKGDLESMYRLAERAAYGFNNEIPDFKRALYWLNRIDEFDAPDDLIKDATALRTVITNMKGFGAYFVPKTPLPSGAKMLIKQAEELGEKINPKTGISDLKLEQLKAKNLTPKEPPPLGFTKYTDEFKPGQIDEISQAFKNPKLDGYGPVPNAKSGQVLPQYTGEFADHVAEKFGWEKGTYVSGGGYRPSSGIYYQRVEMADTGKGHWYRFTRDGPGKPWQYKGRVSSGEVPFMPDWNDVKNTGSINYYKPKVLGQDTPSIPTVKAHTNFQAGPVKVGDFDPRAGLTQKMSGKALDEPKALGSADYKQSLNEAIQRDLDSGERSAVAEWSGSTYRRIRGHMAGDSNSEEYGTGYLHQTVANFHSAMMKLPRHKSEVIRGIRGVSEQVVLDEYSPGNVFYWTAHSSASNKLSTAEAFAGSSSYGTVGVVFKVKGGRKVFIKQLSNISSEEESILLARTQYRVTSVSKTDNYYTVEIEETGLYDEKLIEAAKARAATMVDDNIGGIRSVGDEFSDVTILFEGDVI